MDRVLGALRENAALAATGFAAFLNLVGLSYNYAVFATLGYNYADFAEVGDFLVSAFKSPFTLVYTALVLAAMAAVVSRRPAARGDGGDRGAWRGVAAAAAIVVAVAVLPATVGYSAVRLAATGIPAFDIAFGTSGPSLVDCQVFDDDRRVIRTFEGRIVAAAGGVLLLDAPEGGTLVSRGCVVAIRPGA